MNRRFAFALGGILPHHLSPEVKELYWAAILQNLALAMLLLFEPIYLYQQGFGVRGVLMFFLGVYALYVMVMPLGAKFACRFGYEHSMALSTLAQVAYYACLWLVAQAWWWALPAVLLYAMQKMFYWPAYHADFARYSDQTEEGKEISGLTVALSLVFVVGPLLAGLLLTVGSWALLFGVGCGILLLSNWPLLKTAEQFTPIAFSYRATYRRLVAPENLRRLVGYIGFGEELIVLTLWPIFISIIVVQYLEIGAVVAGATLVMALATLYIGKLTDEHNKHSVLRFSTLLYALGWLVRVVTSTPWAVFAVDSWSRLTKNIVSVPLTAITYEQAKTHHIMDSVTFFEMSLAVGKLTACALLIIIFNFTASWAAAWLVAAAMTFLYVLV